MNTYESLLASTVSTLEIRSRKDQNDDPETEFDRHAHKLGGRTIRVSGLRPDVKVLGVANVFHSLVADRLPLDTLKSYWDTGGDDAFQHLPSNLPADQSEQLVYAVGHAVQQCRLIATTRDPAGSHVHHQQQQQAHQQYQGRGQQRQPSLPLQQSYQSQGSVGNREGYRIEAIITFKKRLFVDQIFARDQQTVTWSLPRDRQDLALDGQTLRLDKYVTHHWEAHYGDHDLCARMSSICLGNLVSSSALPQLNNASTDITSAEVPSGSPSDLGHGVLYEAPQPRVLSHWWCSPPPRAQQDVTPGNASSPGSALPDGTDPTTIDAAQESRRVKQLLDQRTAVCSDTAAVYANPARCNIQIAFKPSAWNAWHGGDQTAPDKAPKPPLGWIKLVIKFHDLRSPISVRLLDPAAVSPYHPDPALFDGKIVRYQLIMNLHNPPEIYQQLYRPDRTAEKRKQIDQLLRNKDARQRAGPDEPVMSGSTVNVWLDQWPEGSVRFNAQSFWARSGDFTGVEAAGHCYTYTLNLWEVPGAEDATRLLEVLESCNVVERAERWSVLVPPIRTVSCTPDVWKTVLGRIQNHIPALPHEVGYALLCLTTSGKLPWEVVSPDMLRDIARLSHIAEVALYAIHSSGRFLVDEPLKVIQAQLQAAATHKAQLHTEGEQPFPVKPQQDMMQLLMGLTKPTSGENCCTTKRVQITPTKIKCLPPEMDLSNRVLRHYEYYRDRFVRVSFSDEQGEQMFLTSLATDEKDDESATLMTRQRGKKKKREYESPVIGEPWARLMVERWKHYLRFGFTLLGRQHDLLAFSSNQLRTASAWYMAPVFRRDLTAEHLIKEPHLGGGPDDEAVIYAETVRYWLGSFDDCKHNPAKYAARLSQAFSATVRGLAYIPTLHHEDTLMGNVDGDEGRAGANANDGSYSHNNGYSQGKKISSKTNSKLAASDIGSSSMTALSTISSQSSIDTVTSAQGSTASTSTAVAAAVAALELEESASRRLESVTEDVDGERSEWMVADAFGLPEPRLTFPARRQDPPSEDFYGRRFGDWAFPRPDEPDEGPPPDPMMIDDIVIYDQESHELRVKYIVSDGIGRIGMKLAADIMRKLNMDASRPLAMQVRFGGCKGMLVPWGPDIIPEKAVRVRKSMKKFDSTHNDIEVVQVATFVPGYINRQIICLLLSLGMKEKEGGKVFFYKAQDMAEMLDTMLSQDNQAAAKLRSLGYVDTRTCQVISQALRWGMTVKEPFITRILHHVRNHALGQVRQKHRIFLAASAFLLGVIDETGFLKPNEVFVQVHRPGDAEPFIPTKCWVLVTKNPCLHPGDIRLLRAVDRPELRHLVNVVVFPQRTDRPVTDMIAGSDLDGDQYFVCWDQQVIPIDDETSTPVQDEAASYLPMPIFEVDNVQVDPHLIDQYLHFQVNDTLGMIANAHVAMADQHRLGARSEVCLKLAEKHAHAVDFAKTCRPVTLSQHLRPKNYPDFMENRTKGEVYSRTVLGDIYRWCKTLPDMMQPAAGSVTEPDPRLVLDGVAGWKEELRAAVQLCYAYNCDLLRLMAKYGASSEVELMSGWLTKRFGEHIRKREGLRQQILLEVGTLKGRYQQVFLRLPFPCHVPSTSDKPGLDSLNPEDYLQQAATDLMCQGILNGGVAPGQVAPLGPDVSIQSMNKGTGPTFTPEQEMALVVRASAWYYAAYAPQYHTLGAALESGEYPSKKKVQPTRVNTRVGSTARSGGFSGATTRGGGRACGNATSRGGGSGNKRPVAAHAQAGNAALFEHHGLRLLSFGWLNMGKLLEGVDVVRAQSRVDIDD